MKELDSWAKSLSSRRDVAAKQLALLAKADIAKMPEWPTACVKALLAAPLSFIRKDEAHMFSMEDVEFMSTASPDAVIAAVDVMNRCRRWVDAIGARGQPKAEFLIGLLDVNLVHHVHRKVCKERRTFQSLDAIGIDFVKAISAHFSWEVTPPFVAAEAGSEAKASAATKADKASAKASAANMRLREFTGGVLDAASAASMGYVKDAILKAKHKSTKPQEATITDVKGEEFTVQNRVDTRDESTVSAAVLVDKYELATTVKKEALALQTCVLAHEHPDSVLEYVKAKTRLALHAFHSECTSKFNDWSVQVKPDRRLHLVKAGKKGDVMLVPFTTYVGVARDQKCPHNCISFGVVHTDAKGVEYSAFASRRDSIPTKQEPIEGAVARKEAVEFIVPYFCVRKVSDPTDATFVEAVHEIKEDCGFKMSIPVFVPKGPVKAGWEATVYSRPEKNNQVRAPEEEKPAAEEGPKRGAGAMALALYRGGAGKGKGKESGRAGKKQRT